MPTGHVKKNGKLTRNRESEDRYCSISYTSGNEHETADRSSADPSGHKKTNRVVTVTTRRKSRHSRDNVIAAGGKPLVEYSDVSSETLSSGPELGEIIAEDDQPLLSDGEVSNAELFRIQGKDALHRVHHKNRHHKSRHRHHDESPTVTERTPSPTTHKHRKNKRRDTSPSSQDFVMDDDYITVRSEKSHSKSRKRKHRKDKKSRHSSPASTKRKKKKRHRSRSSSPIEISRTPPLNERPITSPTNDWGDNSPQKHTSPISPSTSPLPGKSPPAAYKRVSPSPVNSDQGVERYESPKRAVVPEVSSLRRGSPLIQGSPHTPLLPAKAYEPARERLGGPSSPGSAGNSPADEGQRLDTLLQKPSAKSVGVIRTVLKSNSISPKVCSSPEKSSPDCTQYYSFPTDHNNIPTGTDASPFLKRSLNMNQESPDTSLVSKKGPDCQEVYSAKMNLMNNIEEKVQSVNAHVHKCGSFDNHMQKSDNPTQKKGNESVFSGNPSKFHDNDVKLIEVEGENKCDSLNEKPLAFVCSKGEKITCSNESESGDQKSKINDNVDQKEKANLLPNAVDLKNDAKATRNSEKIFMRYNDGLRIILGGGAKKSDSDPNDKKGRRGEESSKRSDPDNHKKRHSTKNDGVKLSSSSDKSKKDSSAKSVDYKKAKELRPNENRRKTEQLGFKDCVDSRRRSESDWVRRTVPDWRKEDSFMWRQDQHWRKRKEFSKRYRNYTNRSPILVSGSESHISSGYEEVSSDIENTDSNIHFPPPYRHENKVKRRRIFPGENSAVAQQGLVDSVVPVVLVQGLKFSQKNEVHVTTF